MNPRKYIFSEATIHLIFWLFFFSAVNVNWTADWLDKTIRPLSPAPLSVVIFPFMLYTHAGWAIPRFLNKRYWKIYIAAFLFIFIVPELLRSAAMVLLNPATNYCQEFCSRDSFLLGQPNVVWQAFVFSSAYRFTKDWFVKRLHVDKQDLPSSGLEKHKSPEIQILDNEEATALEQRLEEIMKVNQPFLKQDLSLAELAKQTDTTDKKLSALLNQYMRTNFYDYINSFRIASFKKGVAEGKLAQLSIAGLALQCGFKSKSSFYRTFKKETGMSPTQFIQ